MTTEYLDKSFSNRIKMIIDSTGSAEKLANISGMSSRVIGQYLAGKSDPTRKKLIALSDAAQVNIEWLATGKGPKTNDDRKRFEFKLFTLILEGLDDYETTIEKKLPAFKRAGFINYTYELCYDYDLEDKQIKPLIADTIKGAEYFFASINRILKTSTGKKQVREILSKHLGHPLPIDDAKFDDEEFTYSLLLSAKLIF